MKNNLISQSELTTMLKNIEDYPSYYVGGTLCIDIKLDNGLGGIISVNLSGEYCDFINGDHETMNDENLSLAFSVYKKHRGETSYYKECRDKSKVKCIDAKKVLSIIKE